jgi:hypothetical protein
MDIPLIFSLRFRGGRLGAASIALAAMLIAGSGIAAGGVTDVAPDVPVKAALLYNFAKFVEWPGLPVGAPIAFCIVGDDAIAAALVETVHGQNINGHALDVSMAQASPWWGGCHVLFVAAAETQRSTNGLEAIKALPVLTVSDGKDFSQAGGIIELYVAGERMRFAINVNAADQSGLRLSSRLLGLAKIIRTGPR